MKLSIKLFLIGFFLSFSSYGQSVQVTTSSTSNCIDGSLTINATGGTSPYVYQISSPFYYHEEVSSSHSITINNVPTGNYFVTATDLYNDRGETHETIATPIAATFTRVNATCNNNGNITTSTTGGAAPYSYLWDDGSTTKDVTNLSLGFHYISITDNNGCKYHSDSLYVGYNPNFNPYVNASEYYCQTKATATVVNNEAGNFTYYWKTSPVQTTQTATGLTPGTYEVVITNDMGCSVTRSASINENNAFDITITPTAATCLQANGSLSASASGGTSPYSYLWQNGATTSSLHNLNGNEGYTVVATDALGCKSAKYSYVPQSTPILLSFITTAATCFSTGGSATVNASNGTAPYTYKWGNGSTTSSITNIASNFYYVTVKDANGCESNSYTYVPQNNCFAKITGTVYNDINNNCIQDANEKGRANCSVKYGSDSYTYTDANGSYSIDVAPGNYTLTVIPSLFWTTDCASNTININASAAGSTYNNNNFYITPTSNAHDVSVYMYGESQRPGFTRSVFINYYNAGTQLESGSVEYTFSTDWDYVSAVPTPDYYNPITRTATWNYTALNPGNYSIITVSMNVASSIPLNTPLSSSVKINMFNTDEYIYNNTNYWNTYTRSSFDPNDIQVSPQGTTAEGYITSEQEQLTYQIRFQNTGNDVAYNVTVKSPIDVNLEDYTITMIGASHDYKASVENGFLTFDFTDINLPDSNTNEKGSHGYVLYRVNRKSDLAPLTQIVNKADIYFDYNAPVETNQVKNTIALGTANHDMTSRNEAVTVYPNPCRDRAQLAITLEESSDLSVQLYSASGQQVSILDNAAYGAGQQVIDLNLASLNLKAGLYIVKISANNKVYTKSIIINK